MYKHRSQSLRWSNTKPSSSSYHAMSLIPDRLLLPNKSRLAASEKCFQLSNSHTHPSHVLPVREEAARAKLPSKMNNNKSNLWICLSQTLPVLHILKVPSLARHFIASRTWCQDHPLVWQHGVCCTAAPSLLLVQRRSERTREKLSNWITSHVLRAEDRGLY